MRADSQPRILERVSGGAVAVILDSAAIQGRALQAQMGDYTLVPGFPRSA
jgi:hypothetical protein